MITYTSKKLQRLDVKFDSVQLELLYGYSTALLPVGAKEKEGTFLRLSVPSFHHEWWLVMIDLDLPLVDCSCRQRM